MATLTGLLTTVSLNNGLQIPAVGLGVFKSEPGSTTRDAVLSALKLGYRHVDTAQFYGNEADVGQAVRDSGIPREQIWITTKIMPPTWNDATKAYDATLAGVKESVKRIGFPSVDLILLHAPGQAEGRADAWRALEDAQQQGLLRSIGVSNFGIPHLEKLAQTSRITPAVNQIELHPWLQWRKEVDYCKGKGIVLEAYSPLAKASKLSDAKLVALAKQVNKSPAQVLVRWSIQKGFVTLPKSTNPGRQKENADVFGWELSSADVAEIDSWEADLVTGWDPIRDHPV